MSKKKPDGKKPQKVLVETIPEIVAVLEINEGVVFPSSTFPVHLGVEENAQRLFAFLEEKPFLIMQPLMQDNETPFPVGVLGTVSDINDTEPSLPSFQFSGIHRVFVGRVPGKNGILIAKHTPFLEIPLPAEALHDKAFLDFFAFLRDKFPTLFSLVLHEMRGREDAKKFLALPWVRDIMDRFGHIDENNVVSVIDGMMNLLNQAMFLDKKTRQPISIYAGSLNILAEAPVLFRLLKTAQLVRAVFKRASGVSPGRKDERRAEKKEAESAEDAETNAPQKSGRELIQEELSRTRDITPRFPSLAQAPAGDSLVKLDPEQISVLEQSFLKHMGQYLINQDLLKKRIAQALIRLHTGIADPAKPVILGIICGPTGVGKTESIKALAEFLFGDPTAFVRLDCGDFLEPHDHKRITGAPHSYVGYGDETELSQWKLDQFHFKKQLRERYRDDPEELARALEIADQFTELSKQRLPLGMGSDAQDDVYAALRQLGWNPGEHLSILLVDEMEKAHMNLMKLLLRVLDEGFLRKADGDTVCFKNTIIAFTSNINGKRIAQMISRSGEMGFVPGQKAASEAELSESIYRDTVRAVEKFLLTEILGRIGKERIIVLHPLREKDMFEILETMTLPKLAMTLQEKKNVTLCVTDSAKQFIVREAFDDKINRALGARALAAVVERKIEEKIGNLLELAENSGVSSGDTVVVDVETDAKDAAKQKICLKKIARGSS